MWDKLQGKQSAGQKILDSLREQYRIVASLDLDDEPNQVEGDGHNQVETNNAMPNDECKPKSFESRMAGARQAYNDRKWMIEMKRAIDDEIGRINQVETKDASCNITAVDCTRSFKIGTDPLYTHTALNHRDT